MTGRVTRKPTHSPRAVEAVRNPVRIRVVSTAEQATRLLRGGYCPVECCFGSRSVVCKLRMDHHGPLHELPGVALRAYGESFGARAARPWFAVTGYPDEDATWAIGSLAGLLPHPKRDHEFRNATAEMRNAWTRDWTNLAELINKMDTAPGSTDLTRTDEGRAMLLWRLRGSLPLRDSIAFYAGIDRWRSVLTQASPEELEQVPDLLAIRLKQVRHLRSERFGNRVVLIDSSLFGFSTVYAWEWHEYHRAPVLFVFQPTANGKGIVTAWMQDRETGERLYGDGGLLNVFEQLEPAGWGGRPTIGGSSRGRALTWADARQAADTAARLAG